MASELLALVGKIGGHLDGIEKRGPEIVQGYQKRIVDRVRSLIEGQGGRGGT